MAKYVLGLSTGRRGAAAALLKDGRIVAALEEERFSRKKQDRSFPEKTINALLSEEGVAFSQLAGIACCQSDEPSAQRFCRFQANNPPPLDCFRDDLASAASAFLPSPFHQSAILLIDDQTSIFKGLGPSIEFVKSHGGIGYLYAAFAAYCGFKPRSGEYKLMGLAPYGQIDGEQTRHFETIIKEKMIDLNDDGDCRVTPGILDFCEDHPPFVEAHWRSLLNIAPRKSESTEIAQDYMNLALAIQTVLEDVVLRLAKYVRRITGANHLCMAGDLALNCVSNGRLLREGIFDNIWIQPAASAPGSALGAALAFWHIGMGKERRTNDVEDRMEGSFLGPAFDDKAIIETCKSFNAPFRRIALEEELCNEVADLLDQGKVVGWFQGRMEFGPRALGNRSILADPRNAEMQKRLNLKIKFREGFRPFAPSVQEEVVEDYFDLPVKSPYMLFTAFLKKELRRDLPPDYDQQELWERLYFPRSAFPAITHVNYSARVQTVARKDNPRFWALLEAFRRRHGCPMVVNTSFNVRGEPMVLTPADAYRCFMRSGMDYLAIGSCLLDKSAQPPLKEDGDWRDLYELD